MSGVRVLVGTRKGAFVLAADGVRREWEVRGPFFPGLEVYHLDASPADPNRIWAAPSSGWFGQLGVTVEPVGRVRDVVQRNRRPGRPVVSDEPAGQDRFPAVGGVRR